jgi:hypothetical protein
MTRENHSTWHGTAWLPSVRVRMGVVALAGALALAGCTAAPEASLSPAHTSTPTAAASATSTSTPSPPSTPPPSPAISAPAAAPVLDDLYTLYAASGLPCTWVVDEDGGDGFPRGEATGGRCQDTENGIHTFTSQADVDALLQLNVDSIEPGIFLVGDRWVVGSEHPTDLIQAQTTMGGDLWPADSPLFASQ